VEEFVNMNYKMVLDLEGPKRVFILFVIVVVGILCKWFWGIGWEYLADTTKPIDIGPPLAIIVRTILSTIAALLTFIPTYNKINQPSGESWVPYILAFQNGFFWEALFESVTKAFETAPT
jgi:hypothetical protein